METGNSAGRVQSLQKIAFLTEIKFVEEGQAKRDRQLGRGCRPELTVERVSTARVALLDLTEKVSSPVAPCSLGLLLK